ncbi:hypothetical protein P5G51_015390 [Virgibacillus sp. 179-BFC.A HS]|uniref:Uncharacterized protein n=1 Tax=Tigheibacillus jepli TaxID=3035914 RepID=A0ABU5CJM9_9BACI|nr:hypothetical protein [Virgibacillus sp. 179-BFC.A HS]MDY0406564.1 hypothetical protein [Virgibacillus sp. 179-BFC.A HS]
MQKSRSRIYKAAHKTDKTAPKNKQAALPHKIKKLQIKVLKRNPKTARMAALPIFKNKAKVE